MKLFYNMELAFAIGLLIVGFVILIKGADFLVDGASALAKRFNISDMIIGLTIVSFGTSAPELVVSVGAGIKGNNALIIGNVLGSNLYNVCLILGAAGLIYPLTVQKATVFKEIPYSMFIAVLLLILANDAVLMGGDNLLTKIDGFILAIFFAGFMYYIYTMSKNSSEPLDEEIKPMPLPKSTLLIVGGLAALILGGNLVVDKATFLASHLGIPDRIIAVTVIAIGTSLPELATSVVAAFKKNSDIAVGNVVGSNIFNILFVLSASLMVSPKTVPYDTASNTDIYGILIATIILTVFIIMGAKSTVEDGSKIYRLERWQAAILLMMAIGYTVYLLTGS